MDLRLLRPFLLKLADSPFPGLQERAVGLASGKEFRDSREDEKILDPALEKTNPEEFGKGEKALEDRFLGGLMPELDLPEPGVPDSFGKAGSLLTALKAKRASAYVRDYPVSALPQATRQDVAKFSPGPVRRQVVEYGMVVSELEPKADPHNYKLALSRVKEELDGKSRRQALEEFFAKAKEKHVLLLNDSIIDGHHFLAKAKVLEVTSSLKVLDLTPLRFQKEAQDSVFARLVQLKRKSDRTRKPHTLRSRPVES